MNRIKNQLVIISILSGIFLWKTAKIYDAFSAINYKLNNMSDQAKINEQLKDFINLEGVDTTRNLLQKDYSKDNTE